MKLADLLGTVANHPLKDYEWAPALLTALNEGAPEHLHVTLEHTGTQVITQLVLRGPATVLQFANADYDLATGALTAVAEPAPAPAMPVPQVHVVTTPAPAPAAPARDLSSTQWSANRVLGIGGGLMIALITVALLVFVYTGKEPSPAQERLIDKALTVMGDMAKNTQAAEEQRRQPQPPDPGPLPSYEPFPPPNAQPQYPAPVQQHEYPQ